MLATVFDKISKPGRVINLLLFAIYCYGLFLIALFAYRHPHYNWDMLPYMALVISQSNRDVKQVHDLTYKSASENIPSKDYGNLVGSERRKELSENSQAFFNTLPFYAVKPMYIKMVSLFHKAGFSLPISTVMPSIIFYMLIGLLFFYWLLKYLNIVWAFATSLFIMLSGFMVFMPRLSSPDCMSAFLLLSSFYFIIEKPSIVLVFLFLLLSVFARLDNVIPGFFILSFLCYTRQWQKKIDLKYYFLMILILAGCYFLITAITMKPFGWNILYYSTYARYMNLSHSFHASFSIKEYAELVFSHIATAIVFYNFLFFMFFIAMLLYPGKFKSFTIEQLLSILLVVTILIRFILYPDLSDRFNIAYYLFFILMFIKKYTGILSGLKLSPAGEG